jgi:hypothetical protein
MIVLLQPRTTNPPVVMSYDFKETVAAHAGKIINVN